MTKRQRYLCALASVGLGLALLAGPGCNRRTAPARSLPALVSHAGWPESFNRALKSAHEKADAEKENPEALRRLARLYHANGFYAEARTCYESVAAMPAGMNARDHYSLADLALNQNDLKGAEKELAEVLKTEPDYLPARLALAAVLFKSGREDEAAKEYERGLTTEPNNPQAMIGLARIELQRGEDPAAHARLEKLMAAHPESTAGAALFAQLLRRRGETERAEALNQWSRQRPEPIPPDPWMTALFADLYDRQRLGLKFEEYFKTGQIAEALPFLQRFEELDPNSPIPHLLKGWSAAQAHRDEDAVQQYRLALQKGGDAEKICPYLVRSLLALKKEAEAAELMAAYHAKAPDSTAIAIAYADVAIRQGDEKLARRLLTEILEREPYLYPQNMSLAKILLAAGDRDGAAVCLQRVAAIYPRDIPAHALLGEYFLGKSDPASAIAALEPVRPFVDPKSPAAAGVNALLGAAYLQSANREVESERWAESVSWYNKAIALTPADPEPYAGKANACVQLKQYSEAAGALQTLASMDPQNPTIYLTLGDVFLLDGKNTEARQQWEKAKSLVAAGDQELRAALDERLGGRATPETVR